MDTIVAVVSTVVSIAFALVWWLVSTVLWMAVWLVLPLAVVAFIGCALLKPPLGSLWCARG